MMRWHGISIEIGLRPSAPPTARAARAHADPSRDVAITGGVAPADLADLAEHQLVEGRAVAEIDRDVGGVGRLAAQQGLDRGQGGAQDGRRRIVAVGVGQGDDREVESSSDLVDELEPRRSPSRRRRPRASVAATRNGAPPPSSVVITA